MSRSRRSLPAVLEQTTQTFPSLEDHLIIFYCYPLLQVVANAVAALSDIHEASLALPPSLPPSPSGSTSTPRPSPTLFVIDPPTLNKLLLALNECSEWGRIAILNALSRYKAGGGGGARGGAVNGDGEGEEGDSREKESEHICERVMPQFQHANAAVVLGAVKVSL